MNKILKYIKNPKSILIYLMNKNFFFFLPDKLYLKWKFKLIMGYKLDLDNPKTFNEKLQWLKLYDRNPEYTKMVDKYEVREYIKEKIGGEYLIPLLGVYDNFDDIDFSKLPNQFVIKCTHDSGGLIICKDKSSFDIKNAKKKINKFMKRNYYYSSREFPYKNVKPRIIIEEYMEDKIAKELIDYKFMCFNGDPKMLFVCNDRFSKDGLHVTFFDLDWNKLPFERHYASSNQKIKKPINFDKMLEFSKKMSKNIPFVRVDWYEIDGKLYFGELTFYPGSGYEEFNPMEWDKKIGNMLNLNLNESKNKRNNNIALIMPGLGYGGAERVAISLCNWIVDNTDDNVTILSFDTKKPVYELNKKVKITNFNCKSNSRFKSIVNRYKFCKTNLHQLNANIIFTMFYRSELYAYFSKTKNAVLIGSERCNILERNFFGRFYSRLAAKKCDKFIFQTNDIKKYYPLKVAKKSIVIPNAISNFKVYDVKVNNKENVITAMGRLTEQKGFDILIKAFAIVNKKYHNYVLKIFGEGEEKNNLQELINELNLQKKVELCGVNEDAINHIANSKIFVLSSRYEGMPNALIEAMATGTACISTNCKFGPSELIKDGENGLLIPVDSIEILTEKIILLLENDNLRKKIEQNAIKLRKQLDADIIYKKYYDYFVGEENEK